MNATTASGLLITALAILCLAIVLWGLRLALQRTGIDGHRQKRMFNNTALVFGGWIIMLAILGATGVLSVPQLPPRPMFIVLPLLVLILALSYTAPLKSILQATPLHWLVYMQSFRIGVELWFWYAWKQGVFPEIMTFEGANLDIIAGILALVAGLIIVKRPALSGITTVVYSISGIAILMNTLRAAALSMPSSIQQYPYDERLMLLGQPFFIYLPGILVPLALGLHILSLRQVYLLSRNNKKVMAAA